VGVVWLAVVSLVETFSMERRPLPIQAMHRRNELTSLSETDMCCSNGSRRTDCGANPKD